MNEPTYPTGVPDILDAERRITSQIRVAQWLVVANIHVAVAITALIGVTVLIVLGPMIPAGILTVTAVANFVAAVFCFCFSARERREQS